MASVPPKRSRTPERRRGRSPSGSCSRGRSPPRWAGRRGRNERVVERVAPAGNFLVLSKTNYYDWAALMRVMLQARGLWDAVIEGTSDYTEDRLALEVISKAVSAEMMGTMASKPSAKAA
jgi:hypothetical protein